MQSVSSPLMQIIQYNEILVFMLPPSLQLTADCLLSLPCAVCSSVTNVPLVSHLVDTKRVSLQMVSIYKMPPCMSALHTVCVPVQ